MSSSGTSAIACTKPSCFSGRDDGAAALVELADDRALELLGELHLDRMIGSRMVGLALRVGLAEAHERGGAEGDFRRVDRVRRAVVDDARTPTIGKPMSGPFFIASWKPLSQAGMNSRGMAPPVMSSTNS